MKKIFLDGDNVITSLGFTSGETFQSLLADRIGLVRCSDPALTPAPVPLSLVTTSLLDDKFAEVLLVDRPDLSGQQFTRLEKLFILSVDDALGRSRIDPRSERMVLFVSTTKGNIDLLEERHRGLFGKDRLLLWKLADMVNGFFRFRNRPVVISNACISGVSAIGLASRMIDAGLYDHAVVTGGDILSEFVISGFQAFQALSPEPCKPYDAARNGLSLGEGCGTVVLTTLPPEEPGERIAVRGFATSNDATHISAPSRTGEELALAIGKACREAGTDPAAIGYVSAHGTATPYNDEMESKALHLAGFGATPVNSFKGYWGHTLGAAGVIESVIALRSMRENRLVRSAGYSENGVPEKLNVITAHTAAPLGNILKVASGFGGCNAAIVFGKDE